ncbi:MAG TPA: hypothetical protein EYP56_20815 [Planctomycetaceae bacterium]|nr:hypothetical protein [Planctomycetaceae bacterium]
MKGKMNFDLATVQQWLMDHVEKIVLASVVLVLLLFVYRAVTRGGYERTPEDLEQVVASAEQKIANGGFPVEADAENLAFGVERPELSVKGYELEELDPSIWEKKGLRGMPDHYPVEDLRGTAGHGALAAAAGFMSGEESSAPVMAMGAGGTSPTKGVRWVVLTGLVPYAAQVEAYKEAFKDVEYHTPYDQPRYFRVKVERAEVSDPSRPGQLKWEPVGVAGAWQQLRSMGVTGPGAMSGDDIHPAHYVPLTQAWNFSVPVTFPLPPIKNHRWGPDICHLPEIPLARDLELEKPAQLQQQQQTPEELPDELVPGQMPGPTAAMGPTGPMGGSSAYGALGGYGEMDEEGAMDMMASGGMMSGGMMPRGYGTAVTAQSGVLKEEDLKYRLFRFFDFSVEQGKHYVYRVALQLLNPNYKVEKQYLESEELGKSWYVETSFSDPSGVITVPRDAEVLAGPVTPSRGREPKAEVVVVGFEFETGEEKFDDFQVLRGQLLNFLNHEIEPTGPGLTGYGGYAGLGEMGEEGEDLMRLMASGGGEEEMMSDMGGMGTGAAERRMGPQEKETVDLVTDTLVLDIRGGEPIPRRTTFKVPGKILLMDIAGRLVVRDELDDEERFQMYKPAEAKPGRRPTQEGLTDTDMLGSEYEGMDEELGLMMGGREGRRGGRGRSSRRRMMRGAMGEGEMDF